MQNDPSLEWASRALKEYLQGSGIPEHDLDAFVKDEISVVLMGATQQGKTSLALRLLGAEPYQITELDTALAGGVKKVGRSSTRSTSILRAVGSENYSERLNRLTKQVLNDETNEKDELLLELPLDGGEGTRITQVIDLVGLESGTETPEKKRLAREQAKKWLQRADLKVIVVRASSITDVVIGDYSYAYNEELKNLFGYWYVNPDTSFIAVTFAWNDTKEELFKGERLSNMLKKASPEDVQNQTKQRLQEVLRTEFSKENSNQKFPNVSILPFSLPSQINMENPIELKKFKATEVSLECLRIRVTKEIPLMFKLKSAFAHPKKIEVDIRRQIDRLEKKQEHFDELSVIHRQKVTEEKCDIKQSHDDESMVRAELKAMSNSPILVSKCIRRTIENSAWTALPSIKQLRENFPNPKGRIWSNQGAMKDGIRTIWQSHFDNIRSRLITTLRQLGDDVRSGFPKELRPVLASQKIRNVIKTGTQLYISLFADNSELERIIPDNWHKNEGWSIAREALRTFCSSCTDEMAKNINQSVLNIVTRDKTFIAFSDQAKDRSELYGKRTLIRKNEIQQSHSRRESRIKSLESEVKSHEIELKELRGKLQNAMGYKDLLSNNYKRYWNERVEEINSTSSGLRKVELLGEMHASTVLFEEITCFAMSES